MKRFNFGGSFVRIWKNSLVEKRASEETLDKSDKGRAEGKFVSVTLYCVPSNRATSQRFWVVHAGTLSTT